MKKILATAAALSLMLIACGDDASSTSPNPSTGGEKKTNAASDYHPGECRTDIACARNEDGKAYLISGEKDGYQVVVPFVSFPRSAWIDGDFFSERSGDTLYVWDEQKESNGDLTMAQPCVADLVFDISAEDADIKFFKHFDDVYEVEPGPVPTHIFRHTFSDALLLRAKSLRLVARSRLRAKNQRLVAQSLLRAKSPRQVLLSHLRRWLWLGTCTI